MKKLLYILLGIGLVFTSCRDNDGKEVSLGKLGLISADVLFDVPGGEGTIVVDSNSSVTAVLDDDSWCTVSVSGNTINLSVDPLYRLESRSTFVTLSSGGRSIPVAIIQEGIALSKYVYSFTAAGGTQEIELPGYSDPINRVTLKNNNQFSYTISSDRHSVSVTTPANTNIPQVENVLTIYYSAGEEDKIEVTLVQAGRPMLMSDVVGSYVINAVSNWEGPVVERIRIEADGEDKVKIIDLCSNLYATATEETEVSGTLNFDNNTIVVASGQLLVGITTVDGEPVYFSDVDGAASVTFQVVNSGVITGDSWGYGVEDDTWIDIYLTSNWRRSSTPSPVAPAAFSAKNLTPKVYYPQAVK